MTKIPQVFHAEDLQILLDFVIASSHFETIVSFFAKYVE